jgi:hypothetical protein
MPELLLRQAPSPFDDVLVLDQWSSGYLARLEITSTSTSVLRTLLSFEGLGVSSARVDLENSIATSIPVFF